MSMEDLEKKHANTQLWVPKEYRDKLIIPWKAIIVFLLKFLIVGTIVFEVSFHSVLYLMIHSPAFRYNPIILYLNKMLHVMLEN